jgi:hAT family C-terminal dimerisation region
MAFDYLYIPAISYKAERAFSGYKYIISNHRSRLGKDNTSEPTGNLRPGEIIR